MNGIYQTIIAAIKTFLQVFGNAYFRRAIIDGSVILLLVKYRKRIMLYLRKILGPLVHTYLVQYTSTTKIDNLRNQFRGIQIPLEKQSNTHTHPDAAAGRSTTNIAMDKYIRDVGFNAYSVSMSMRDMRNGNDGTRLYYTAKDMSMPMRNDKLKSTHILKFVDTDYYCDMSQYLNQGNAALLYTFCPVEVAGSVPDGTFTIENNVVHTKINGGATYSHELWDYDVDSLVFDYWWGSQIYLVESKTLKDPTRRLVGLFPVRTIKGPLGWLIPGQRLERRNFTYGNVNMSRYQIKEAGSVVPKISIGIPGTRICATISEVAFQTALIRCELAKNPSMSDVERVLRSFDASVPQSAASLFMRLWHVDRNALSKITSVYTIGNSCDELMYQTTVPLVTEDGKPTLRVAGPMYLDGSVAPASSVNNDVETLRGRVLAIKNNDKSRALPPFYHQCMDEFVKLLIPDHVMHTGTPYPEEYVEQQQTRPSQRAIAERAKPFSWFSKFTVDSFQKAESYAKFTSPRNISTTPGDHKLRYSGFMLALADQIKKFDWYAFGKDPKTLSELMCDLALRATQLTPTDFSKFDGTHCEFLVELEELTGKRFFAPDYHQEFTKLHMDQFNAKGRTKQGILYNTGYSRLSGSAETSIFNTENNAFIAYLVLRICKHSPADAWKKLGLYGGDDGNTPDVDPDIYTAVVKRLGMGLKAEVIKPGNPVPFLGRVFLDPWTTPESICDVSRAVCKLHTTSSDISIPDAVVLQRKAVSFLITDANTPFISHWARAILRVLPLDKKYHTLVAKLDGILLKDATWFSQYTEKFMSPKPMDPLAWSIAAKSLDCTVTELEQYCSKFNAVSTMKEMYMGKLFCFDLKSEVCASFRGEILDAVKKEKTEKEKKADEWAKNALQAPKSKEPNAKKPKAEAKVVACVSSGKTGAIGSADAKPKAGPPEKK